MKNGPHTHAGRFLFWGEKVRSCVGKTTQNRNDTHVGPIWDEDQHVRLR